MHILDVTRDPDVGGGQVLVVLDVESDADLTGCPDCGVVAVGHGRHVQVLHDAPSFGTPVRVRWRKRIWRCPEPSCRRGTWTEEHDFTPPRAKLTSRAVEWAVSLLRLDDTTVSAIARPLGVNWHTCWNAVKKHAETSIDIKKRASGVKAAEVAERLNLRDYRPTVLKDPISHWIEADCWNPPSLPNHTFNSLKTFCGPVGFRKSANNADSKRGTSALWFSRHRRGGDAMLHHRTLNPVVIRDWSTKIEMFTSALALTADTSTASHKSLNLDRPRSPAEFTAYARTHWFRPQPRPSDWLDNATEPVAWAERESGQRPATGARPALPGEKRLYAKLPVKSNPLRSHLRFDD